MDSTHPELSGVVLSLVDPNGREQAGVLSRLDALNLGLKADLVVLSGDYFDPDAVSDEELKSLRSELTIVGGEVVFGERDSL